MNNNNESDDDSWEQEFWDPSHRKSLYGIESDSSDGDEVNATNQLHQIPPRNKTRAQNVLKETDRLSSAFYTKYLLPASLVPNKDSGIWDTTTKVGGTFRRRFRVPFILFDGIVAEVSKLDARSATDAAGESIISCSLLVLGSLRVLATGCTFDAIEELTNTSAESQRLFFQRFCSWGSAKALDCIKLPSNEEELCHITGLYERLGLPGCVGSIDCVHIVWDRCRAGLLSSCKGKEKMPTLAFQVIVSHTRKILAVCGFFHGCMNDKTIARYDPAISRLRDGVDFLSQHSWWCYNKEKERTHQKGLYFICDGGYHPWQCLIPPYKHQILGTDLEAWSSHIESIRKDVECTFGILKTRFRFLKNPIRLHNPEQIREAFETCCVLHNLLMDFDGRDSWEEWLEDLDDVADDCCHQNGDCQAQRSIYHGMGGAFVRSNFRRAEPGAYDEIPHHDNDATGDGDINPPSVTEVLAFIQRREQLIVHYSVCAMNRELLLGA